MEKYFTLTAKYGLLFIIAVLVIVGLSFDFKAVNIEVFYNLNEGKIKILGIVLGVVVSGFLFLIGGFQTQLKEKSNVIESQNKQIIKNGLLFVEELKGVTKALNENSRRDNETLVLVNKLANTVEKLQIRIEESDKTLLKHDDFIRSLKIKNATG